MARLRLWVSPGAARTEVVSCLEGVYRIRVAAPATEGRANAALAEFLAQRLGLPRSAVVLLRGAGSRHKLVEAKGVSEEEARRLLLGK